MACHWIRIWFVWQVAEQQPVLVVLWLLPYSHTERNHQKFGHSFEFQYNSHFLEHITSYYISWNNVVLALLVLKVGKSRSFSPSVMLLDHLVGQLYRKFFQQKSSCELILHSKWSRWKRAVTDNSYSTSYSSMSDCCPPVVETFTFYSLLGTIHKWRHAKNWNFDPKCHRDKLRVR